MFGSGDQEDLCKGEFSLDVCNRKHEEIHPGFEQEVSCKMTTYSGAHLKPNGLWSTDGKLKIPQRNSKINLIFY